MPVPISCPYCNTGFTLAEVPPARRATCPRCGEAFPIHEDAEERSPGTVPTTTVTPAEAPFPGPGIASALPQPRSRWPLIVAVLAVVAIGTGLAVYILQGRFGARPGPPPPLEPELHVTLPGALVGLGLLPPDCNVAFAVQPGPLLGYAARTNRDPLDLLAQAGVPARVFATLGRRRDLARRDRSHRRRHPDRPRSRVPAHRGAHAPPAARRRGAVPPTV